MYEAVTHEFRVTVTPQFLKHESADNQYFWAYTVIIKNESQKVAQLKTRYWKITDAKGRIQEVNGVGVVGKTPELQPGESFTYTSGCPLDDPSGIMVGHYGMVNSDGESFKIHIPAFSLDCPETNNTIH